MKTVYNATTRLQKLSTADYEIADGQPDISRWDVRDETGKKWGKIKDLLFDETSRKVRYLVINLDKSDWIPIDRDVLVPIGIAELHPENDDVILTGVTAAQLTALPEYDAAHFDGEVEATIRNVLSAPATTSTLSAHPDDFYRHDHFDDTRLYRNRVSTGREINLPGSSLPGESTIDHLPGRTGPVKLGTRNPDNKWDNDGHPDNDYPVRDDDFGPDDGSPVKVPPNI